MFDHSLNHGSGVWLGSRGGCKQAVTILLRCCPNAKVNGLPRAYKGRFKSAGRERHQPARMTVHPGEA